MSVLMPEPPSTGDPVTAAVLQLLDAGLPEHVAAAVVRAMDAATPGTVSPGRPPFGLVSASVLIEKSRASRQAKGQSASRNRGGKASNARRQRLVQRDGAWCAYCGCVFADLAEATLDHVIPNGVVRTWDTWDLVLACSRCNSAKGESIPDFMVPAFQIVLVIALWRAQYKAARREARAKAKEQTRAAMAAVSAATTAANVATTFTGTTAHTSSDTTGGTR